MVINVSEINNEHIIIPKVYNLDDTLIKIKDQGETNQCSLYSTVQSIEYLISMNKSLLEDQKLNNISIYNLYLKSYLCANQLNPNNNKNYKIINPSCSLNNYGMDEGFSLKNTLYGAMYGICEEQVWKNIPLYVNHQANFTFPFQHLNPVLDNDYIYNRTNPHIYLNKYIKIVPKILEDTTSILQKNTLDIKKSKVQLRNKKSKGKQINKKSKDGQINDKSKGENNDLISFSVKQISIDDTFYDNFTNDNFMNEEFEIYKDNLYEYDDKLDNYKYKLTEKQGLINMIQENLFKYKCPILMSLILPKEIKDCIDDNNILITKDLTKYSYEDYHACQLVGYDDKYFKIASSWGTTFGDKGYFKINKKYIFDKYDGNNLNCDFNQLYIINGIKIIYTDKIFNISNNTLSY